MAIPVLQAGMFLGRTVRTAAAGGFTLVESLPGYRREPMHCHANHYLFLALGGRFDGRFDGTIAPPIGQPLMASFLPAGHRHSYLWHGTDRRCLNIEISADRAHRLEAVCPLPRAPVTLLTRTTAGLARALGRELAGPAGPHPLCVEGLVLEMLGEFTRQSEATSAAVPPWLTRIRDAVHSNLADPPSLDALATEAGVHVSHLCRAFRQHFGRTIGDDIRRMRVDRACRMIGSRSSQALAQIAIAAGFSDQSHMTREFRHWIGATPSDIRAGGRA